MKLIPDWKIPPEVGLVWPSKLPDHGYDVNELIKIYNLFIEMLIGNLSGNLKIRLFHRPDALIDISEIIKTKSILEEVKYIQDIWIRDFSPFWLKEDNQIKSIKGKYYPWYVNETYAKRSRPDNELGKKIGGKNCHVLSIEKQNIILDGGSLVFNGRGVGIISNRVISDNEYFFIDNLKNELTKQLNLEKLYLIPVEPGDDTGHVDGLVRFLDDKTLLVSEYPYTRESNKDYISAAEYKKSQLIVNLIADYFKELGFDIYKVPNGIPCQSTFESAIGNYMNFLRVGDKFFLPQYGVEKQDQNAIHALIKAGVAPDNIIPGPDCNQLAKEGGVLNCISTHIHSNTND